MKKLLVMAAAAVMVLGGCSDKDQPDTDVLVEEITIEQSAGDDASGAADAAAEVAEMADEAAEQAAEAAEKAADAAVEAADEAADATQDAAGSAMGQ